MSWIDLNPYYIGIRMAQILFFAKFMPVWVYEAKIRAKKRQIAKKFVDIECETPQTWSVFTDETLYPDCGINKSLLQVLTETSSLLGSCWSYNGNFVLGFYNEGRKVRW